MIYHSLQIVRFALAFAGVVGANSTFGGTLRVEMQPTLLKSDADTLAAEAGQERSAQPQTEIARLSWLVSKIELQHADGTWMPGADWFGFFGTGAKHSYTDATGVPSGRYRAVRFQVGLDADTNSRPPEAFAPEHALHAAIDTMHWGWQGGFIFLAVEGRHNGRAFTYHLANSGNQAAITLPMDLDITTDATLTLAIDTEALLSEIDFAKDSISSHSRAGDPLVQKLRAGLAKAFRVVSVRGELLQPDRNAGLTTRSELPPGARAYSIRVPQRFPQLQLPADNPLTEEGVALGRRLFKDTRLSINETQSCASCHEQSRAFADGRRVSIGAQGQAGQRNAMALFNLAWHNGFFWDGRAKTLREQVLMPVTDAHEMNETLPRMVAKLEADDTYARQFAKAFGSPGIDNERVAKALEQYLMTLVSHDSKFDRAVRKETNLSEAETRGLQLFVTENDPARGLRGADCFHCHGGMLFTNHQFQNNGLILLSNDLGRMAITGEPADRGKFKTPSLRNIGLTAPYMHDGRFATLEEVVEHYNSGITISNTLDPNLAKHSNGHLNLTAQEKADLVAFLRTLTDERFTGTSGGNLTQN